MVDWFIKIKYGIIQMLNINTVTTHHRKALRVLRLYYHSSGADAELRGFYNEIQLPNEYSNKNVKIIRGKGGAQRSQTFSPIFSLKVRV